MTDRAVPNLPSRDFDATIAFYGGFGFAQDYRDEGWLILRRGDLGFWHQRESPGGSDREPGRSR